MVLAWNAAQVIPPPDAGVTTWASSGERSEWGPQTALSDAASGPGVRGEVDAIPRVRLEFATGAADRCYRRPS